MKTAEQIAEKLWEKYCSKDSYTGNTIMTSWLFSQALREYGELVRQRAVAECKNSQRGDGRKQARQDTAASCAAAIERMELP